ncbi:MAG TPA: TonB-dependent receptor plug domain-containing protein, partial [Nannocystaceae bacterium]|nr:TonB-dependent receptor plug domain-containing protein [Nannocystaceae bacterium]
QGDPLRAVQNLPGVARAPAGAGLLVLRGAPPGQSRVFLGEHPVPRAFHVLGFTSVIPADAIDTLELVPGNYAARYGDALGGVIVMHPRTVRRDGVHGFAKVDLTSAAAMIETPIKRAGLFVAAQRGYVDGVLRLAEKVDETAVFALPRYYDYQAQLDVPFRGGRELVARVIGSGDRWTSRIIDFMGNREEVLELTDQFHRSELVWRARRGPWRVLVTPAFRVDARRTKQQFGAQKFRGYSTTWRAEVERRLSRRAAVLLGVDGEVMPFRQTTDMPAFGGPTQKLTGYDAVLGAYASATIMLGPVTLWPGVRATAFARRLDDGAATTRAHVIDPRLLASYEPSDRWTVNAALGSYSQAAPLSGSGSSGVLDGNTGLGGGIVVLPASARAAIDPGIGVGDLNARTTINQAVHGSLGANWHDSHGLEIGGTAFVRWYEELRTGQSIFDRTGFGSRYPFENDVLNYGLELLVRKRLGNRLYAWASYTVMRSQIRSPQTPASVGGVIPGNYDQRHNLVLLASYALPRGFRIGGRFRLVSGAPFTPAVGVLVLDSGRQPVYGATNSERFPVFHQLDLRLDKSWVLKRSVVLAYVDVQNVYNHRNVEAYIYAFDFRDRTGQVGLPIFPTIGVRVEW